MRTQHPFTISRPATFHAAARRSRGFTLVELMLTLAVATVLATLAVPSFRSIVTKTQVSGLNNDLASDLQFARAEAVSRQASVIVTAATGGWQNGWTVEVSPAVEGGTAEILREHTAVPADYVVTGGAATKVTYLSQGMSDSASGACFTIYSAHAAGKPANFLRVLPAGMLQQSTGTTAPEGSGCAAPTA